MQLEVEMDKWKVLDSKDIFVSKFLRVYVDQCELPDGRVMPHYYVMEFPDWVNVIALTEDGLAILVEQYRHAAGCGFLEVPGGSTDPRSKEKPEEAAARELLEETGYKSEEWLHVGFHYPNPATQANRLHTYIAFNCKKIQEPELDLYEDLRLRIIPIKELYDKVNKGELSHSLILASLSLARPHLKNWLT